MIQVSYLNNLAFLQEIFIPPEKTHKISMEIEQRRLKVDEDQIVKDKDELEKIYFSIITLNKFAYTEKPLYLQITDSYEQLKQSPKHLTTIEQDDIIVENSITYRKCQEFHINYGDKQKRHQFLIQILKNKYSIIISQERNEMWIKGVKIYVLKYSTLRGKQQNWIITDILKNQIIKMHIDLSQQTIPAIQKFFKNHKIEYKCTDFQQMLKPQISPSHFDYQQKKTINRFKQTKELKQSIKQLSKQAKKKIILEQLNAKEISGSDFSDKLKTFKCPIMTCQSIYQHISDIYFHIKQQHKEILDIGIRLTKHGSIQCSDRSLNLVLYLWRLYPEVVNKMIKRIQNIQR